MSLWTVLIHPRAPGRSSRGSSGPRNERGFVKQRAVAPEFKPCRWEPSGNLRVETRVETRWKPAGRKTPQVSTQVSTLGYDVATSASDRKCPFYGRFSALPLRFIRPACGWKLETQTGNLSLAKACAERPRNQSARRRTQKFAAAPRHHPQHHDPVLTSTKIVQSFELRTQR